MGSRAPPPPPIAYQDVPGGSLDQQNSDNLLAGPRPRHATGTNADDPPAHQQPVQTTNSSATVSVIDDTVNNTGGTNIHKPQGANVSGKQPQYTTTAGKRVRPVDDSDESDDVASKARCVLPGRVTVDEYYGMVNQLNQHNSLQADFASAQSTIKEFSEVYNKRNRECEKEIAELKKANEAHLASLTASQQRITALEEELKTAATTSTSYSSQLAELTSENTALKSQRDRLKESVCELEQSVDAIKGGAQYDGQSRIDRLQRDLLSLEDQRKTDETNWSNKVANLTATATAKDAEIGSLKRQISGFETNAARMQTSIEELRASHAKLSEETAGDQEDLQESTAANEMLLNQLNEREQTIASQLNSITTLKNELNGARAAHFSDVSQLQAQLNSARVVNESLQAELQDQDAKKSQVHSNSSSLKKLFSNTASSKPTEVDRARDQLKAVEAENNRLQAATADEIGQLNTKMERMKEDLELRLKTAQNAEESAIATLNTERTEARAKIAELNKTVEEGTALRDECLKAVAVAQTDTQHIQAKFEAAEQQLTGVRKEIEMLQGQKADLEVFTNSNQITHDQQIAQLREELSKAQTMVSNLRAQEEAQLNTTRETAEQEAQKRKDETDQLNHALLQAQAAEVQLRKSLKDEEEKYKAAVQQQDHLTAEKAKLE
ncbi:hypothetical protein EIP91_009165, partial [Steccherinum ochraceum]